MTQHTNTHPRSYNNNNPTTQFRCARRHLCTVWSDECHQQQWRVHCCGNCRKQQRLFQPRIHVQKGRSHWKIQVRGDVSVSSGGDVVCGWLCSLRWMVLRKDVQHTKIQRTHACMHRTHTLNCLSRPFPHFPAFLSFYPQNHQLYQQWRELAGPLARLHWCWAVGVKHHCNEPVGTLCGQGWLAG